MRDQLILVVLINYLMIMQYLKKNIGTLINDTIA